MDSKRIVWLPEDENKNLSLFGVSFLLAKEVIQNEATFMIENLHGDFNFIGLTDDMRTVLYVYCVDEVGLRRVKFARYATVSEKNIFFSNLARSKR